jgi:hypothetical protein
MFGISTFASALVAITLLPSAFGSSLRRLETQSAHTSLAINDNCAPPQPNYGYVGNGIGSKPSSTPEGCCGVCQATDKCTNYSWTNTNGGTCYLMSETYKGYAVDGVYSGGVRSPCTFQTDVDYVENDIGNVPGKDASECCTKCRGFSGCKAWSWSNYNGGTCWLKSQKGSVIYKQGVTSGTL